jgi:hypothetical protein
MSEVILRNGLGENRGYQASQGGSEWDHFRSWRTVAGFAHGDPTAVR